MLQTEGDRGQPVTKIHVGDPLGNTVSRPWSVFDTHMH